MKPIEREILSAVILGVTLPIVLTAGVVLIMQYEKEIDAFALAHSGLLGWSMLIGAAMLVVRYRKRW